MWKFSRLKKNAAELGWAGQNKEGAMQLEPSVGWLQFLISKLKHLLMEGQLRIGWPLTLSDIGVCSPATSTCM